MYLSENQLSDKPPADDDELEQLIEEIRAAEFEEKGARS
jgi:hypothetical protein